MSSSLAQLALKTRVDLSDSPVYRSSAEISPKKITFNLTDDENPSKQTFCLVLIMTDNTRGHSNSMF